MSDARRGSSVDENYASDSISVTDQCELVADERRRQLLRYLIEHADRPRGIDELVTHVQTIEQTTERDRIRVSLEHVHIPKLAQEGVVEYTSDERSVRYRPHRELEELLAFLDER